MKRAVLNVACGRWYPQGSVRLERSLEDQGDNAERLFWVNDYPPGSPPHQDQPYAFKPSAFAHALAEGFDQALWLDASVQLCRPLDDIWEWIAEDGYCFGNDGWFVGQWCNDHALEAMGLTREEAWTIPLMDGKIIGLDLTQDIGKSFLARWKDYADQGLFKGEWYGPQQHRHDITCGAVIAHRLGMELRTGFTTMGSCADGTYIRAGGM